VERAVRLRAIRREAEPHVALSVRAEVDARHRADASVRDQILRHLPRRGRHGARRRRPGWIDPEERVERAGWRLAGEDAAAERVNPLVEQIATRLQLDPELLDAGLRALERANAAKLDHRR